MISVRTFLLLLRAMVRVKHMPSFGVLNLCCDGTL